MAKSTSTKTPAKKATKPAAKKVVKKTVPLKKKAASEKTTKSSALKKVIKASVKAKKAVPVKAAKVVKAASPKDSFKAKKISSIKSNGSKKIIKKNATAIIKKKDVTMAKKLTPKKEPEKAAPKAAKVEKAPSTKKLKEKNNNHYVEPAVKPKQAKDIKGYNKHDLEHFKKIIIEKRDEILEQLQSLKEQVLDPATGEYINENSPYSLHMAEQGTDAMEREKTFLYYQRENKFLGYLEDALKRIESGTYGICIECIDEPQHLCPTCPLVPKARLEAVPHSQLCLPIKQRQEKR